MSVVSRRRAIPAALAIGLAGCGEVLIQPSKTSTTTTATTATIGEGGGGASGLGEGGSLGSGGDLPLCATTPWAKSYGASDDQRAVAVAVDASCDIYVAGESVGPVDLGNGPLKGKWYAGGTLARIRSSGETVWSRWIESSNGGVGLTAVAAAPKGGVLVSGVFRGTLDLGSGPITAGASYEDTFVAKLDEEGGVVWVRHLHASYGCNPRGATLAVSPDGTILVTGAFSGTIDIDGTTLTATGEDIFVVRLGEEGEVLWSKRFGGPGNTLDQITAVAVGDDGTIAIAGEYEGQLDLGNGPLPFTYGGGFLGALDPSGNALWSRPFPEAACGYGDCPIRVLVTPAGHIHALARKAAGDSGSEALWVTFDAQGDVEAKTDLEGPFIQGAVPTDEGGAVIAGKIGDHVAARLDAQASSLWERGALSLENTQDSDRGGIAVALDPGGGSVIVVGSFLGSVSFESGSLQSAGKHDMFVAKLPLH